MGSLVSVSAVLFKYVRLAEHPVYESLTVISKSLWISLPARAPVSLPL